MLYDDTTECLSPDLCGYVRTDNLVISLGHVQEEVRPGMRVRSCHELSFLSLSGGRSEDIA